MVSAVLTGLRNGVETVSPFDRRARWTYILMGVPAVGSVVLLHALHFTFDTFAMLPYLLWAIALAFAAMLLRRYGHERFSGAMETIALIYLQGIPSIVLLFPLTAISAPLADRSLAGVDRFLGFDWLAFASLFAFHPVAQKALTLAYMSFDWQPLIIFPVLFATGLGDRAWRFLTASTAACLLTVLVYPFAPALGAFRHFAVNPAAFPHMQAAWQFGTVIEAFKAGEKTITPASFQGLVSFPSYHATAALLFSWAAWPLRRLRWPFILLNALMACSALIVGAHYLIDLIGGVAIGVICLLAAAWVERPRESLRGRIDGRPCAV